VTKKRLNDATPEEWDRVNAPQHVYYGGERVEYPVRAYTYGETDPVTEEDLDELFADGSFTNGEGYDTYEEYMAKWQLKEEQDEARARAIAQNGNDGLHYDALDKQVAGDHYKSLGLQPLEMTYANFGYEGLKASVYTKVNKYLLRDKESEVKDIKKAIHCLEILLEKADG
jgi:hypothetical protein